MPRMSEPLILAVEPTATRPGHAAFIFLKGSTSTKKFSQIVPPNTVYFMSTQKFEPFPDLKTALRQSIAMPVSTFIDVLEFFKKEWPNVIARCHFLLNVLKPTFLTPTHFEPHFYIHYDANLSYSKKFNNLVILQFHVNSKDANSFDFIHLIKFERSGLFHPSVMMQMTEKLDLLYDMIHD